MAQDSRSKSGQERKSSPSAAQPHSQRDPERNPRSEREVRLAEALRANLRRRKAQTAARKDLIELDSECDDNAPSVGDKNTRNETP